MKKLAATLSHTWVLLAVACSSACMDMNDHAWLDVKNDSASGVRKLVLLAGDSEVPLDSLSPGQSTLLQIDKQLWCETEKSIQVGVRFVDGKGESHEDSIAVPTQPGAVGEVQASLREGGQVHWERSLKIP